MRIPSGVTDQYIYFIAVDATDFTTRETGLSSFTVYRSRNGGAAAAMTTPTINETDATNMPGVYELLLDEDMTIASGNDSEEMVFHITATGMHPVTRTIELYRPKITAGNTLGVAADGDISGNVDGSVASVTGAVGSVTGAVGSVSSGGITAASIAADAITAAKIATNAIDADSLATDAVTQIWNHVVEANGSYTAQQVLSVGLAVLAGVTSSGGATFSDPAGTNTRVTATVNGSNERTAMTLTPSS